MLAACPEEIFPFSSTPLNILKSNLNEIKFLQVHFFGLMFMCIMHIGENSTENSFSLFSLYNLFQFSNVLLVMSVKS